MALLCNQDITPERWAHADRLFQGDDGRRVGGSRLIVRDGDVAQELAQGTPGVNVIDPRPQVACVGLEFERLNGTSIAGGKASERRGSLARFPFLI